MAKSLIPLSVRFWAKVQKTDGCWLWLGARHRNGYGGLFIKKQINRSGNRTSIMTGAHRVAWQLAYGAIPEGLFVCHRCDNPGCVRPDHLFLTTHIGNMHDMNKKGRGGQPKGSQNAKAKLTEVNVLAIRARYAAGGITHRALAKQYGVSCTVITYTIQRKKWRHI